MFSFHRSIAQTLAPLLAFVALASLGCTTSIAASYPHLERRSVCVHVPGTELDATEVIFSAENVPISNLHPEVVDRVAPTARTVFEYDPNADPSSTRYLPAPYNELTCPAQFSMLPSGDAQTTPLPGASLDLLVHERRPEIVPQAVTQNLASCPGPSSGFVGDAQQTVAINVYVTNDGQTVSAFIEQSTLGDRTTEACLVNALRTTQWPVANVANVANAVAAAPAALAVPFGARAFFAQPAPAPAVPVPDSGPESGVRLRIPAVEPPGEPGGFRIPYVGVLRFAAPALAGGLVFVTITLWPKAAAPRWLDEMNPITRRPYVSPEEYDAVRRLSPQEILQRQIQEAIKNSKPQAPPAPAPQPQPQPTEPDCPENKSFTPERTDNSTGCFDKKGNVRCYSRRHPPCMGVHTHGILTYQKMRREVCTEVVKEATRCEGDFTVSGTCGRVSTVECGTVGTATSGIFED